MNARFLHCTVLAFLVSIGVALALPVDDPRDQGLDERTHEQMRNLVDVRDLATAFRVEDGGIVFDLGGLDTLLDGRPFDAGTVAGRLCVGPWPFEERDTEFDHRRFRLCSDVEGARGRLRLEELFKPALNSESWTDGGSVLVRLDLVQVREGRDEPLLRADVPLRFRGAPGALEPAPTVIEGPLASRVDSRRPESVWLAFALDRPCAATLVVEDGGAVRRTDLPPGVRHEVEVPSAGPGARCRIEIGGEAATPWRPLPRPVPAGADVRVAYTGDCREGEGFGDREYMGVNLDALERLTALVWNSGAQALLFGGDLINGYTSDPADFRTQLWAFKQACAGFWSSRPVYPAMGNHDSLIRLFHGQGLSWVGLDRWPYDTASAEALFGQVFCNPLDAPLAAPGRPPDLETVYTVQTGSVLAICFNNNWWMSSHADRFGGCPEGVLLDDQLEWIEAALAAAEADPTVKHVLLYAQEPVFPCGGHLKDAMWYRGNNAVRARERRGSELVAVSAGVVDGRNRLVRAVGASPKVAAVLGSDEHAYCRLRITPETPVGDMARDDADGDGRIDAAAGESPGPLGGLARAVWFLTSGGGGAPYYSDEPAPWNSWWKARQAEGSREGYFFTSQENVLLFDAEGDRLRLTVLNSFGETIDRVPDLHAGPN